MSLAGLGSPSHDRACNMSRFSVGGSRGWGGVTAEFRGQGIASYRSIDLRRDDDTPLLDSGGNRNSLSFCLPRYTSHDQSYLRNDAVSDFLAWPSRKEKIPTI